MTRIHALLVSLLIGAALALVACADGPFGPVTVPNEIVTPDDSVQQEPLEPIPEGEQAQVLERKETLAEDEVVTATVSPLLGGSAHLPKAGLTVVFPPLAVSQTTQVTITAPAGDLVGYHFEPEGLQLALPVVVTQDLLKTLNDGLDAKRAVYFTGELAPSVTPVEQLPLTLDGLLGIFWIEHFSGYIIATN